MGCAIVNDIYKEVKVLPGVCYLAKDLSAQYFPGGNTFLDADGVRRSSVMRRDHILLVTFCWMNQGGWACRPLGRAGE